MRTITGLPAGTAAYASFILIELERPIAGSPSVFYRWTNSSKNISFGGSTFLANVIEFDLSAIVSTANGEQAVELTFQDQGDTVKALALLYDFRDWTARVWEVYVDAAFAVYASKSIIFGTTDGVEGDFSGKVDKISIGVTVDSGAGTVQGPREEYAASCRFRYGTARCGASGGSCNRTITNCIANANVVRFGGFPDAPTPDSKYYFGTGVQSVKG